MENMQERNLAVTLPQDKKPRIHELPEFLNVEHPEVLRHRVWMALYVFFGTADD